MPSGPRVGCLERWVRHFFTMLASVGGWWMNPEPSGAEGSSRSAASERGVRVVVWFGASGLSVCGKSVRSYSVPMGLGACMVGRLFS